MPRSWRKSKLIRVVGNWCVNNSVSEDANLANNKRFSFFRFCGRYAPDLGENSVYSRSTRRESYLDRRSLMGGPEENFDGPWKSPNIVCDFISLTFQRLNESSCTNITEQGGFIVGRF